jgi:L-malate glycosyltransferase
VRVIHNGMGVDKFSRARRSRDQVLPGADHGKLIVLVGNMQSDVKGHPLLISAAPAIVREFPDTRFILAGDGEKRQQFEDQVNALGLTQSFLFLGRRNDIAEILACCDIAVLPSKAEGLPNAVLEYMAAGLPIVASNVGGNSEIIRDGVTGRLIAPQDAPALGEALLGLLRDPGLARGIAESGQAYVRQNFSFERLIEETDLLYSELLGRRGRAN